MVTHSNTATLVLSESQHGCCCVRSEQTVEHHSTQQSAPPDGSTMAEVINAWCALKIYTHDERGRGALREYYVTW